MNRNVRLEEKDAKRDAVRKQLLPRSWYERRAERKKRDKRWRLIHLLFTHFHIQTGSGSGSEQLKHCLHVCGSSPSGLTDSSALVQLHLNPVNPHPWDMTPPTNAQCVFEVSERGHILSHLCGHQDRWVGQFVVSVHPEGEEHDGSDGHDGNQRVHQRRQHWRLCRHWLVCCYGNTQRDKKIGQFLNTKYVRITAEGLRMKT